MVLHLFSKNQILINIYLVPDLNQNGAIWSQNKQFVRNGFRLIFTYVTYDPFTSILPEAADGIAFVIQDFSNSAVGDAGKLFLVFSNHTYKNKKID